MQQPAIRPLFDVLSRSLLLVCAIALLLTGIGLGVFAQRNIGMTGDLIALLQDLQGLESLSQDQRPSAGHALSSKLQASFTKPFGDPLHVKLLAANGELLFDSLSDHTTLLHVAEQLSPTPPSPVITRVLQGAGGFSLIISSNPLSELREAAENLSVALGALVTMTALLYRSMRQRMRRAFTPLSGITERLQALESGRIDFAPLPPADTAELNRMAASVNHLQSEWAVQQTRQREWINRLQDLQESERRQIAAELHDELGQHLTALQVDAATLQRLCVDAPESRACAGAILDNSKTLLQRTRGLLMQLRPAGLDGAEDQTAALAASLHRLADDWRARLPATSIELSLQLPDFNLPSRLSLTSFRLVQEALTNAARHAGASQIHVNLEHRDDRLLISVRDNGVGFADPADPATSATAHEPGLPDIPRSLRERAQANGGQVRIDTAQGSGCCVSVSLPLYRSASDE